MASTRPSSPSAGSCSSSATASSMEWSRSNEIRRHRSCGLHRLAPGRGAASARRRRRLRRRLHRLLRPGGEGGERTRTRCRAYRPRRREPRARRRGRRIPSRGPAGRAQLRRRLSALPAPERARDAARLPVRRRGRRSRRVRLVVLGVRRGGAVPDARGRTAAADLAVRHHEARVRGARARLRA